eukprot:scaffold96860_cov19-Prasinocladus_malaysianus.AAC.1
MAPPVRRWLMLRSCPGSLGLQENRHIVPISMINATQRKHLHQHRAKPLTPVVKQKCLSATEYDVYYKLRKCHEWATKQRLKPLNRKTKSDVLKLPMTIPWKVLSLAASPEYFKLAQKPSKSIIDNNGEMFYLIKIRIDVKSLND